MTKKELKEEQSVAELVPVLLKPVVHPIEPEKRPGRPRITAIEELQRKVDKQKQYYIASSFDLLLANVANEVPMLCKDDCPCDNSCTIDASEQPRMGKEHQLSGWRCPIEFHIVMTAFYGYLSELNIDVAKPTEVQTAAELAGIQVKKRRIHIALNDEGYSIENGVGVTKMGEAVVNKQAHPLWSVLEKLEKREQQIMKDFATTRAQQMKILLELQNKSRKSYAEWMSEMSGDE